MRAFAINLQDEGLRSPEYYRDKSQCLSFGDCSPAEMGIIKAMKLKRGYIDPDELIRRLRLLKPSENFVLREYNHRLMRWDKSPIKEKSIVVPPPHSDWFLEQSDNIEDMRSQLGDRRTDNLRREVEASWVKKRNTERTPLPSLHLLKNMGHSPSGTVFPRYLVKGLRELREVANARGKRYYVEEYKKAKVKRSKIISHWQEGKPDTVLAFDPVSIYRTWPLELMAQLDAVDQEAMRRGSERYMADLRETEKDMQTLIGFWSDCGLITGQRTPLSDTDPGPKEMV